MIVLLVALATGVGSSARFLLDATISRRRRGPFPLGTFVINVAGAFVLGLTTGLAAHGNLGADAGSLLGPGFCAGFTTFSTWMAETASAWRAGDRPTAVANVVATVAVGCAAAAAGLALGRG